MQLVEVVSFSCFGFYFLIDSRILFGGIGAACGWVKVEVGEKGWEREGPLLVYSKFRY